jgi:RimJ/RimL family protein N-acetyltransferase
VSLYPLLVGRLVRLTALANADASVIAQWHQDADYMRLLDARPAAPKNEGQIAEWIREGQRGRETFLFGIRTVQEDALIGFVELGEVLWTHRNSWLAIGIGDPQQRGRGYGSEAMRLTLDFAFRELNLHRLQLTVFSYNTAAMALYERLGFTREGAYREFLERDSVRHDVFMYGLLRSEWLGR